MEKGKADQAKERGETVQIRVKRLDISRIRMHLRPFPSRRTALDDGLTVLRRGDVVFAAA